MELTRIQWIYKAALLFKDLRKVNDESSMINFLKKKDQILKIYEICDFDANSFKKRTSTFGNQSYYLKKCGFLLMDRKRVYYYDPNWEKMKDGYIKTFHELEKAILEGEYSHIYKFATSLEELKNKMKLNRGPKNDSSDGAYSFIYNFLFQAKKFGIGKESPFIDAQNLFISIFNAVNSLEYDECLSAENRKVINFFIDKLQANMIENVLPILMLEEIGIGSLTEVSDQKIYLFNNVTGSDINIGNNNIIFKSVTKKEGKEEKEEVINE